MSRETTIIGDKEYAYSKIAAFQANSILLKLQKIVLPVIGEVAGDGGKVTSIMDIDIGQAFQVLSEKLDESIITDIVLPMFKLSQVACTTDSIKIDSSMAIDKVFVDADGLADFYTLVYEVLKYNFAGFFMQLANRFGGKSGEPEAKA